MRRLPCPDFILLLLVLAGLSSGTASAQIQIRFAAPASNRFAKDFELKLDISSAKQLDTVQAEFAGQVIPLPAVPQPSARISISGLAYGEYELTVTARDVFGTEAKVSRQLWVDRPPRIVVQAPDVGAVARLSVHVLASCEDDGPQGCQIRVSARIEDKVFGNPRSSTETPFKLDRPEAVDEEFCLSEYAGKRMRFQLWASDGNQSSAVVERIVLVNDDARLTEVARVPGALLDYDDERLLFVDAQRRARVMDRASGNIQTLLEGLSSNAPQAPLTGFTPYGDYGYLFPGSAVLLHGGLIVQVKDGKLLALVDSSSSFGQFLAGRFVVYPTKSGDAQFYDLVTETATPLRPITPSSVVRLAADGSLFWRYADELRRYRQGQNELLAKAQRTRSFSPSSEGDDVVFNVDKTIVLMRGGQRHVLADFSHLPYDDEPPGALLSRGWVAFARLGGGVAQVWTRSATDVEQQVTFLGTDSWPIALGPDGTVVYVNDKQYYLAVPGAPHVPLPLEQTTRLRLENSAAYLVLGGTLFRVDPTTPPGTLTCPAPPVPGRGCTAVGDGSVWLLLLTLLGLGIRRTRRAGFASS